MISHWENLRSGLAPQPELTSFQNPRFKAIKALQKSQQRRKQQRFMVEGAREISQALRGRYRLEELFICPQLLSDTALKVLQDLRKDEPRLRYTQLAKPLFEALAVRENSDGLLATFDSKRWTLAQLGLVAQKKPALFLITCGVEKPGNLGAIIRSADGAGCSGILVLGSGSDIYHPNVIRASLGTVCSLPIVSVSDEEARSFCKHNNLRICVASQTTHSGPYHQWDFTVPTAILVGSEAEGVPKEWIEPHNAVEIPMLGHADSLNVSVATSILLYEARRQRSVPTTQI